MLKPELGKKQNPCKYYDLQGLVFLGWSWWDLNPRPDKLLADFLHA